MPSEDRGIQVFETLAGPRAAFHSALVSAAEEIEAYLGSRRAPRDGRGRQVAAELGAFAAGRVDPERFAALLTDERTVDEGAADLMERALAVLRELIRAGDGLFRVDVAPGGNLAAAIDSGLAVAGRAFGAARVAEMARSGRVATAKEDPAGPWPYARWNRAERLLGPPLVVEVDGGDLVTGGLATYLDGHQKIALVVRGAAPPASLARLITPGVFVTQAAEAAELAPFAAFEGPAVAALVPEGCARFTHDPGAGASPAERTQVAYVPEEKPRRAVGQVSAFAQSEELRHLAALAQAGTAPGVGSEDRTAEEDAAPADMLAAWLLKQADLQDVDA